LEVFPPLAAEDRCLDIGTASGGFALFFAQIGNWIFVEPNADHICAARKMLKGNFIQTDGESFLREENQKFHLISALAILFFIPDKERFFGLVRDRLAPGGQFIVSGDENSGSSFFGPLRRALGIEAFTGGNHNVGYKDIRKFLEASGLGVRSVSRSTGPATMAIQTALDGLLMAFSRMDAKSKNYKLTLPMTGETKRLRLKSLAHWPLRLLTEFCKLVDALLWFLPRYDYVICAEVSNRQGVIMAREK
jgi:SAM-dependent methyltransferase